MGGSLSSPCRGSGRHCLALALVALSSRGRWEGWKVLATASEWEGQKPEREREGRRGTRWDDLVQVSQTARE